VGWVIASQENIKTIRNISSLAMGGVSRLSQIACAQLLDLDRCIHARRAIAAFYGGQRKRYGAILRELGFSLYTGEGGFYHWCKLPGNMTCVEFNERLFKLGAAVLPGTLCDMFRRGESGPMGSFIRYEGIVLHCLQTRDPSYLIFFNLDFLLEPFRLNCSKEMWKSYATP